MIQKTLVKRCFVVFASKSDAESINNLLEPSVETINFAPNQSDQAFKVEARHFVPTYGDFLKKHLKHPHFYKITDDLASGSFDYYSAAESTFVVRDEAVNSLKSMFSTSCIVNRYLDGSFTIAHNNHSVCQTARDIAETVEDESIQTTYTSTVVGTTKNISCTVFILPDDLYSSISMNPTTIILTNTFELYLSKLGLKSKNGAEISSFIDNGITLYQSIYSEAVEEKVIRNVMKVISKEKSFEKSMKSLAKLVVKDEEFSPVSYIKMSAIVCRSILQCFSIYEGYVLMAGIIDAYPRIASYEL